MKRLRIWKQLPLPAVIIALMVLTGCTVTKRHREVSGLFNNDLTRMDQTFRRVEKEFKDGKTFTKQDIRALGFDFEGKKVRNVPCLRGEKAFPNLILQGGTQESMALQIQLRDSLERCRVPYVNTTSTRKRYHWGSDGAKTNGDSYVYVFTFQNDKLISLAQEEKGRVAIQNSEYKFGGSIGELMIGGMITGAKKGIP